MKISLPGTLYRLVIFILFMGIFFACEDPKAKSRELITQGLMELDKGNVRAAKNFFDEAIQKDPKNAMAFYYRGSILYNLDMAHPQPALADLTTAITLDSTYADAYATRGQIRFYMDDKDGACSDWRKAESLGKPNMYDKTRYCP